MTMRFSTALAVVLMCTLIDAAQGEGPVNTLDTAQSRIDGLVDKLRSGSVQRIEIVQIPSRILTRTRVTPEMLERSFHYKLVVRDIRGGPYAASLTAALASTSADPASEMGDLRWGIAFFDVNDQRIDSLYFDASGRHGAVDSLATVFKSGLPKWLGENF